MKVKVVPKLTKSLVLHKNLFDNNVIRPRSSFTKVYGLNFIFDSSSLVFNKKFGAPRRADWSTPRIRRLERPANSARKVISIVQRFNDCLLLFKMRKIVEGSYIFSNTVRLITQSFLEKKKKSESYHAIRSIIGLPCRGQRTKTNARTCKRSRSLKTQESVKFLNLVCRHQSLSFLEYARSLSIKRQEMLKFRMLQDIMRQKRYRPKVKGIDKEQHYEDVYKRIIAAKKKRKNITR